MYLLIHEAGELTKTNELTDDDYEAYSLGIVGIVRITNYRGMEYCYGGEWLDVEDCEEGTENE